MLNKITKADITEAKEVSFHPSGAITTAALAQGMMVLASNDMMTPGLKDEIGTTGDRWYGGILIVAAAMARVVDNHGRFDKGVFTYEHVEVEPKDVAVGDSNLSVWLLKAIDPEAWYQICDNWYQPTQEALTKVFLEWANQAGVPVWEAP